MKLTKKRSLYRHFFFIYSVLMIFLTGIILSSIYLGIHYYSLNTSKKQLQLLSTKAVGYFEKCIESAEAANNGMYSNVRTMQDLIAFLNMGNEEYQKYKLDRFSTSPLTHYYGHRNYIQEQFYKDTRLKAVELISYEKTKKFVYTADEKNYNLDATEIDGNQEVSMLSDYFTVKKQIRNLYQIKVLGEINFYYSLKEIETICEQNQFGDIRISYDNEVVLDTGEGKKPEYLLETELIGGYEVCSYVPKQEVFRVTMTIRVMIACAVIGLFCFFELVMYRYVLRLKTRLIKILQGMSQVEGGNLEVSLSYRQDGDELDLISSNFNLMCIKLKGYIEESYLARLKQKDYEMQLLQAQINPHFLYNTLEAIRMKALISNDKETAKMLYMMSDIFKSQLKEPSLITVKREVELEERYLKMFQMRYENKFSYEIIYDEEMNEKKILKFVMQPLIENYFAHGMRKNETDNHIRISIELKGKEVLVTIDDNGVGMTPQDIEYYQNKLMHPNLSEKEHFGIINTDQQIKTFYGPDYGLKLEQGKPQGLRVILFLSDIKGEDNV